MDTPANPSFGRIQIPEPWSHSHPHTLPHDLGRFRTADLRRADLQDLTCQSAPRSCLYSLCKQLLPRFIGRAESTGQPIGRAHSGCRFAKLQHRDKGEFWKSTRIPSLRVPHLCPSALAAATTPRVLLEYGVTAHPG